jgi:hypothetical protein
MCNKGIVVITSHFLKRYIKGITTKQLKKNNVSDRWVGGISFTIIIIGQNLKPLNVLWKMS